MSGFFPILKPKLEKNPDKLEKSPTNWKKSRQIGKKAAIAERDPSGAHVEAK